jgi:hypothetical protein
MTVGTLSRVQFSPNVSNLVLIFHCAGCKLALAETHIIQKTCSS